jgi:hypothetical protein
MQPTIQQLAAELVDCRGKLQELEERQKAERKPYEEAKQFISEKLIEKMAKTKTLSTRFEDFTISRKRSVRAVVLNEFIAMAQLRKDGRSDLVLEILSPQALKEVEKGSLALDGVTVESKEYISIKQNKETPAAGDSKS